VQYPVDALLHFDSIVQKMNLIRISAGSIAGFSLIELLIVVAIISILAAIAVPNFLEAQTRAKVARIKADQRSMVTAIESYAVDNNKYPIRRHNFPVMPISQYAPNFDEKIFVPAQPAAAIGMHVITTPIAYMTSLPSDLFFRAARALSAPGNAFSDAIDYWDSEQVDAWMATVTGSNFIAGRSKGYVLISVGPDGALGVTALGLPGNYPGESNFTRQSTQFFYDSTNGTISRGNIYRFQAGFEQSEFVRRTN
jgi:prepilin-type N-terminal cleavage/methylation domain-containing protein